MADFTAFVTNIFNNLKESVKTEQSQDTPATLCVESSSAAETAVLGAAIGARLAKGTAVALEGGLGVGKTCLAGGITGALGVRVPVTSPTYTIVNEYEGDFCAVYHIDAYRLSGVEDFFCTCGSDFFDGEGIYLIEWPENIAEALPPHTLRIKINILSNGNRKFSIYG